MNTIQRRNKMKYSLKWVNIIQNKAIWNMQHNIINKFKHKNHIED